MLKNVKRKVFSLVMCSALLVSALSVLAGSSSKQFGAGSEAGTAALNCYTTSAYASTTPATSGASCATTVTIYGDGSFSSSGGQTAYVEYMHSGSASRATSTHRIGTFYTTLSAGV